MRMIHILIKIIMLPVILALTLILWICIFLNSISGLIMGILSLIFALTGIASWLFDLASGGECLKMMIAAVVIFLIPNIGSWLIERIAAIRCGLCYFMGS